MGGESSKLPLNKELGVDIRTKKIELEQIRRGGWRKFRDLLNIAMPMMRPTIGFKIRTPWEKAIPIPTTRITC